MSKKKWFKHNQKAEQENEEKTKQEFNRDLAKLLDKYEVILVPVVEIRKRPQVIVTNKDKKNANTKN